MSLSKLVIVVLSFILLVSNSYAMEKYINDGVVTRLILGHYKPSGGECPDGGNCIYFEYLENKELKSSYVFVEMNLNDGNKGLAMYDILKQSLLTGMKIEAWSTKSWNEQYKVVEALGLSHHAHQSHHTVID